VPLPAFCSLWLGGDLGPIGEACLASFVQHGHAVTLYAYDAVRRLPDGVTLADASTVLPASRIIRHRPTGSHALFSDLFRYELLRRSAGIWIDCDVFCLRPFANQPEVVCGYEIDERIGSAVLRLPAASAILGRLIGLFSEQSPMPPWEPPHVLTQLQAARARGTAFDISYLPWGSAGPRAITYFARQDDATMAAVRSRDVFYPVNWQEAESLVTANFDLRKSLTPDTLAVHLWHSWLARHRLAIARNSPLAMMLSGTFKL
jgi:hypothetical protein